MIDVKRNVRALLLVFGLRAATVPAARAQGAAEAQPATQAAQDEYVPLDQLPESEKLPAAPFLTSAYAFSWVAIVVFVSMLWRRLARVEQELRHARGDVAPR